MKISHLLFCSLFMAAFAGLSIAKSGQDSLETHLQRYKNLSGQFTQIISSENSLRTQSSTGEFWIKKT